MLELSTFGSVGGAAGNCRLYPAKAARGQDGRIFPWGNAPPDCLKAHYIACKEQRAPLEKTLPDGASPYGVYAMAGNVAEWVADWYDPMYYAYSPAHNPTGPATGSYRVVRGGSWNDMGTFLRTDWRHLSEVADKRIGFRCAASAAP